MRNRRIILAFLIAPVMPSIISLLILGVPDITYVLMMLFFSIPFSYLPSIFIGYPFMKWLKNNNHLNLINFVIGGSVVGIVVLYLFEFVFVALLDSSSSLVPQMLDIIWGTVLGISVALPLGLIAGIPIKKSSKRRAD